MGLCSRGGHTVKSHEPMRARKLRSRFQIEYQPVQSRILERGLSYGRQLDATQESAARYMAAVIARRGIKASELYVQKVGTGGIGKTGPPTWQERGRDVAGGDPPARTRLFIHGPEGMLDGIASIEFVEPQFYSNTCYNSRYFGRGSLNLRTMAVLGNPTSSPGGFSLWRS
ncbi:hypothetical protein CC78DRAFT_577698 [Lojkania enalia]|uniref:Uncharacterized protein n=1 Tax=Lojkania enalia TaxID=147567 RepID=A0A9P4KFK8_9PLEO|nr:hypothetical protein CC78DRAFT_577698 [Didymosphaeria enalia]